MQSELRDVFLAEVSAYAAAQNLPLSLPNEHFDPPAKDDMYLKASVLPTDAEVRTLCSGISSNVWILQISIYVREDMGETIAADQADQIRLTFPYGHKFTTANHTFTVITPPSPAPSIPMGGWSSTPVRFRSITIH